MNVNSLNDLSSWGTNFLGQASTTASSLVRSGTKVVKSTLKDNFGSFVNATHVVEDGQGGSRTLQEVSLIAEGGFGAVVQVRDTRTGKDFALKKIRCQEGVVVASSLEAALAEARLLQELPPHPNIIKCFGCSTQSSPDGSKVVKVLMELCPGGQLHEYMTSRDGRMTIKELLEPFRQITAAVNHLHSQRPPIQHRDLKVENVLQAGDGCWKLCDFGSCSTKTLPAKELPRPELLALQEQIDKTVTMLYRPPEMADVSLNYRNGWPIDTQVDIWMLGCILFTLAFFQHPFQDEATVMSISSAKYFIPDHENARSAKLCGLIHWLLARNPGDRPTAAKLVEVLDGISKWAYQDFHAMLPVAVHEKVAKSKSLYTARKEDVDIPVGFVTAAGTAPPKKRQQQAVVATATVTPSSAAPMEDLLCGEATDAFDLRFALAPGGDSSNSGGGYGSADGKAKASVPRGTGGYVGGGRSGGGGSGVYATEDLLSLVTPANSSTAPPPIPSTPTDAQPTLAASFDDFADFASAPPPPTISNRSNNGFGSTAIATASVGNNNFADDGWADFGSAPAAPSTPGGAAVGTRSSGPSNGAVSVDLLGLM